MKKKTIASHDILIVKFVRTALPRGKRGAPSLGPFSLFPGFKILRGDIKSGEHRRRHRNCGYTVFVTVSSSLFIFSCFLPFPPLFFRPLPFLPRVSIGRVRKQGNFGGGSKNIFVRVILRKVAANSRVYNGIKQ